MPVLALLNGVGVPEGFRFLQWGWWVVHVIGIIVLLYIGFLAGKKKAGRS